MGEWAVTASIPRSCCRRRGRASTKLKISDVTVREMLALRGRETHLPEKTALQVLDAVFRHLDFISRLQVDGAWSAILYAWPHLLPGETSYRTYFHPGLDRFMELTHGRNGTPGAGRLFLYAYQVLGDQRYLEVARKAGEWLLSAQQPEGYWVNHYDRHTGGRPTPRQEVLSSHRRTVHRDYPTFQDGRQSQAALFMARLYLVTLEERWLEAFRRSADFILKAQNPNGSWGYYYDLKEGRSENRNQDPHGAEFDNGNQRTQLRVMQLAHHLTGLDKYRDAIVRNGEWHLAAQLGPPTYGWALAYDGRNQPVWSRVYHPPALSPGSSASACENLFFLYDLTGDRKYLEPVSRYLEWEKSALIQVTLGGEKVAMRSQLVDHTTGRPIAVDLKNWKTYFLDTPQERAAFLKTGSALWANPDQLSEEDFPWAAFMKRPDGPRLEPELRKTPRGIAAHARAHDPGPTGRVRFTDHRCGVGADPGSAEPKRNLAGFEYQARRPGLLQHRGLFPTGRVPSLPVAVAAGTVEDPVGRDPTRDLELSQPHRGAGTRPAASELDGGEERGKLPHRLRAGAIRAEERGRGSGGFPAVGYGSTMKWGTRLSPTPGDEEGTGMSPLLVIRPGWSAFPGRRPCVSRSSRNRSP